MRLFLTGLALAGVVVGLYFLQTAIARRIANNNQEWKDEVISGTYSYQVNTPDHILSLSPELKEISGLALAKSDSLLLAVEDEGGFIYYIDKHSGAITNKVRFGKNDDYEGITAVNDLVYIVTSNGNIISYDTLGNSEKYKSLLKSSHDVEGLTYLPSSDQLLLACKGSGPQSKNYIKKIFSFDLKTNQLNEIPFATLDSREITKSLGLKENKPYFKPSGICIDQNENIYILSSELKAMIITDTKGNLKSLSRLDPSLHLQPEGMVVDRDGILYIANEGKSSIGKIYVFKPKINKL